MLEERRAREEATATLEERVAGAITRFSGTMRFVYVHIFVYGFWILANLGVVPGVPKFDPSFVILAMVASVEAIFLSTFILITQNRMSAAADKRAELDLQNQPSCGARGHQARRILISGRRSLGRGDRCRR
jgi:uncharacterized membrane protein